MASSLQSLGLPDESDYRSLIEEVGSDVVRKRLREYGVFVAGVNEELPLYVSRFIFSDTWYNDLFRTMDSDHNHTTLTGVRGEGVTVDQLETEARAQTTKPIPLKHPARITAVERCLTEPGFVVSVDYSRHRPKRSKYYQSEPLQIQIICKPVNDYLMELYSYTETPTDPLVLREVAEHILKHAGAELLVLDINALEVSKRVTLFDKIIDRVSGGSWRVRDVIELTITRDRTISNSDGADALEQDSSDEDDTRSLTPEETRVLRSAILEGQNLRQLDLVTQLVDQGYYFSGVEFWAFNPSGKTLRSEELKIRIDFKKKPKALVVRASRLRILLENNKYEESAAIKTTLTEEVVQYFWAEVHRIYEELRGIAKSKAKKVTRRPPLTNS